MAEKQVQCTERILKVETIPLHTDITDITDITDTTDITDITDITGDYEKERYIRHRAASSFRGMHF